MKKNPQPQFDFNDSSKTEEKSSVKKIQFQPIGGLFDGYTLEDKGGYITQEFQDFGYRMAMELNDQEHKSLYMRLAKNTNRGILEQALSFVADAPNVKSKAKLFMWKLKQLKNEKSEAKKSPSNSDKT